jgi:hypothetical protein
MTRAMAATLESGGENKQGKFRPYRLLEHRREMIFR